MFSGGQYAIVFAQMRRTVSRRQLSILFLDSVDCLTTIITEYAVKTVNFLISLRDVDIMANQ